MSWWGNILPSLQEFLEEESITIIVLLNIFAAWDCCPRWREEGRGGRGIGEEGEGSQGWGQGKIPHACLLLVPVVGLSSMDKIILKKLHTYVGQVCSSVVSGLCVTLEIPHTSPHTHTHTSTYACIYTCVHAHTHHHHLNQLHKIKRTALETFSRKIIDLRFQCPLLPPTNQTSFIKDTLSISSAFEYAGRHIGCTWWIPLPPPRQGTV